MSSIQEEKKLSTIPEQTAVDEQKPTEQKSDPAIAALVKLGFNLLVEQEIPDIADRRIVQNVLMGLSSGSVTLEQLNKSVQIIDKFIDESLRPEYDAMIVELLKRQFSNLVQSSRSASASAT